MKEEQDNTLKLYHNQYLSFIDLEKLDDWEKAWKGQDKELFEKILFTHGMDPAFGYSIEQALHVPRTERNQRKMDFGPLVRFKERVDKEFEPYRCVEDICRDDPSSFVRSGMRESLNSGVSLNDIIQERLSIHQKLLKNMAEKEKSNKESE